MKVAHEAIAECVTDVLFVYCDLLLNRGTATSKLFVANESIYIDYFIESAPYGFLFTSCKTLENERVSAANE